MIVTGAHIPRQALLSLYCATMQLTLHVDYLECLQQRVMAFENQICLMHDNQQLWNNSCIEDQTMDILMRGFVHRVTQIYPQLPEPSTDIYSTTISFLLAHHVCEEVRYFSVYPDDPIMAPEEASPNPSPPRTTGEPSGKGEAETRAATSGASSLFPYK